MTAREASLGALRAFRQNADYRAELLRLSKKLPDRRDQALAAQITLGVVRNLALCDFYIASASSIKMTKIEPQALDILRSAVYQLAFLDRVPKSAVVNEAVKLSRKKLNPRAAGFVNAVLRKLSAGLPEIPGSAGRAEYLSLRYSHPEWLVREFIAEFGEDNTEALLQKNNQEPPVYARVNTLKTTPERLTNELLSLGITAAPSSLPGTLELRSPGDIAALEPFGRGDFFVQDPASTMAALSAGVFPGARVIDACAAPGGKSFAMALEMQNKGEILSFDTGAKVSLIEEGARRLGILIISARAGDSSVLDEALIKTADVVYVDAPCSGFGVIRKKPEIRFKTQEETAHLPGQALAILSNCALYVKPGGTLVYSTCTLRRCENEDVVEKFMENAAAFELRSQETYLPHVHGTDGFFTAVFKRLL